MAEEFEWDAQKATLNLRKHGIAFKDAQFVFDDAFATPSFDDAGYGEQRMMTTEMVNGVLLTVVYTERGDRTRLRA